MAIAKKWTKPKIYISRKRKLVEKEISLRTYFKRYGVWNYRDGAPASYLQ